MGDHRSKSHADRWPIPPPMITAFLGLILEHTSLILALIERGSSGMSMCSICSPMLDATSGSDWSLSSSSERRMAIISESDLIGKPGLLSPTSTCYSGNHYTSIML